MALVRKWVEDEPERLNQAVTMAEEKQKEAQDRLEAAEHQRRNASEEARFLEARNGQQMQQFFQQLQQHQRQQHEINSGKLTQHQLQDLRLLLISRGMSQEQAALVLTRFMPHHTPVPAPHPAPHPATLHNPAPNPTLPPATLHNTVPHTIPQSAPHPDVPASMNGNCQGSI